MNLKWFAVFGIWLLVPQAGSGESQPLETQKERMSYAIGADTAKVIRQQEIEVDLDTLIQGLKDGMSGGKLFMTDQDLLAARNAVQKELIRKQAAKKQNRRPAGKKEGAATLPPPAANPQR